MNDTGIMCHDYKPRLTLNGAEKKVIVNCYVSLPPFAAEPQLNLVSAGGKHSPQPEPVRVIEINECDKQLLMEMSPMMIIIMINLSINQKKVFSSNLCKLITTMTHGMTKQFIIYSYLMVVTSKRCCSMKDRLTFGSQKLSRWLSNGSRVWQSI